MGNYTRLADDVRSFFRARGIDVAIEPRGSRGPDIEGVNTPLVGEIKHAAELQRSLGSYWGDWNSSRQFGGKRSGFKLRDLLPPTVDTLSSQAMGFIAVITGQLWHYCEQAALLDGWLVIEKTARQSGTFQEATTFLSSANVAQATDLVEHGVCGFIHFTFRPQWRLAQCQE